MNKEDKQRCIIKRRKLADVISAYEKIKKAGWEITLSKTLSNLACFRVDDLISLGEVAETEPLYIKALNRAAKGNRLFHNGMRPVALSENQTFWASWRSNGLFFGPLAHLIGGTKEYCRIKKLFSF